MDTGNMNEGAWNASDADFEDASILVQPSDRDHVIRPNHYAKWAIEPITFIMKNNLSFEIGNIVKYAVRAGSKIYDGMDVRQSEITDLQKVRRYAEMRINQLEGKDTL